MPGKGSKYTESDWRKVLAAHAAGGTAEIERVMNVKPDNARYLYGRARAYFARDKANDLGPVTDRAVSHAVNRYLASLRPGAPGRYGVSLGALRGFPGTTTDPAVVERAIAEFERRALTAPTGLKRLRALQRIRDLRAALPTLAPDNTDRATFVLYGAKWAAARGFDYETFRDAGVPASVLREAGFRPGAS